MKIFRSGKECAETPKGEFLKVYVNELLLTTYAKTKYKVDRKRLKLPRTCVTNTHTKHLIR